MNNTFSFHSLILPFIYSCFVLTFILFQNYGNNQSFVVFCDVGQGDGSLIRLYNRITIVIDAGPDNSILECLGRYTPFYNRTIDIAIVSHPQKDHMFGFIEMAKRYKIRTFIIPYSVKDEKSFINLKNILISKNVSLQYINNSNIVYLSDALITFLWPPTQCKETDENDCSAIFTFKINNFRVLFTGDATFKLLETLSEKPNLKTNILKVPHHGSSHGLTEKFLRLANPEVAVISVGKKNSYGHPSKSTLDLLRALKIPIRRTDKEGDVVFKLK
ncbi:MAG: hypothetical protein Q7R95_07735 [bacterium]|nr:hypothetical protein [bacterium]